MTPITPPFVTLGLPYLGPQNPLIWKFGSNCTSPKFTPMPYGLLTRCRKCSNCLEYRQNQWKQRSRREHTKWKKHWLVTLTYRNTKEYSYDKVQKWLKTIRKSSSDTISYICATEVESSGARSYNPHHHLVVHCDTLLYRHLAQWKHGHLHAELLKRTDAFYVTKYLTKGTHRIRASTNYGVHSAKPLLRKLWKQYNARIKKGVSGGVPRITTARFIKL